MTKFQIYLLNKLGWFFMAFCVALVLNFFLPRLIPGNPVDAMVGMMAQGGGATGDTLKGIYNAYISQFGLDKPLYEQFFIYIGSLLRGDLGISFMRSPARVQDLIGQALPWTIALQLPAILVGWTIGNTFGVITAYKRGLLDKVVFPLSLLISSTPFYCLSIILLYVLAVHWKIFPPGGGYAFDLVPGYTMEFYKSVAQHYVLPFLSLVMIFIGGQAVGMRSMTIYELDADYVRFSRSLGVKDGRIIAYIFRNAMLPQVTGLALSIGQMVSGALITEIVFNYPGIGSLLMASIRQNDYPVIQGITLILMIAVLVANFVVDITYGIIDPRIRASRVGEK